ncbi:MAG: MFS transporter [bacterium]
MARNSGGRLRVAAILFVTNVVITIGMVMIAPLLPIFARRLGASGAWMGALFAADMAARTVVMPLCGRASDRLGRKPFLLAGILLFCASSYAFTLTPDRTTLLIARTFQGVGAGMIIPTIMAYFGEFSAPNREAFAMGTLNISFFGGLAVGPYLGGLLASRFSLEAPFYFLAASGLLTGGMILLLLPGSAPRKAAAPAAGAPDRPPAVPWRAHLGSRTLQRLCAHRILVSLGISAAWAFVPLYAIGALGLSTYDAGIAVGAITFFTALLISPGGYLADRMDRWRMMLAGTLLLAIALGALSWSTGFWMLVGVCGLMGLAQAVYMPAAYALIVGEGRRMGMGTSLGLYTTALTLGVAAGPLIAGPVVDALGLRAAFVMSGIFGLLAGAAVLGKKSGPAAPPS